MAAFAVFRLPEVFNHRAGFDHPKQPLSRRMAKTNASTCCMRNPAQKRRTGQNYYELLGVSVDSDPQEIKESYRKLQKKYHPDIAGQEGHEHTILLNKAYNVLIKDDLRKDYDASIGHVRVGLGADELNMCYSSWNGPFQPQALFVDENACIGCRECVHNASKTFVMDEITGCARVGVQYGDDDTSIEVAVESCPLDCIHWVEREDLAVLEYLNTPRPKQGYGVFGQGWERPANVFMEAKTFQKHLRQQQAESFNIPRYLYMYFCHEVDLNPSNWFVLDISFRSWMVEGRFMLEISFKAVFWISEPLTIDHSLKQNNFCLYHACFLPVYLYDIMNLVVQKITRSCCQTVK